MAGYVRGIDVSLHQGEMDWPKIAAAGVDFAIVKATQTGFRDPDTDAIAPGSSPDRFFRVNQVGARRTMRRVGYYHWMYLEGGKSPAEQARYFAATVGPLRPGEFMALDFERTAARGRSPAVVIDGIRSFFRELESITRRVPWLYTSPGLADSLDFGEHFARHPLWVVWVRKGRKVQDRPTLPKGWPDFAAWQTGDHVEIPGIPGSVPGITLAPASFLAAGAAPAARPWAKVAIGVGLGAVALKVLHRKKGRR